MKPRRGKLSPFLLIFFVPVAIVTLLAGSLNLVSFYHLRQDHLTSSQQQARGIEQVKLATGINQEVAAIQELVGKTLEQAAAGQLDEAAAYKIHAGVVDRLSILGDRLHDLTDSGSGEDVQDIHQHFQQYRNFIIQATDLAAIDPPGAMRHAYLAANQYLFLSQHTRTVTLAVLDNSQARSASQERLFEQHVFQNAVIGGLLLIALLLISFLLIRKLSGRLSSLSHTLEELAAGVVNPESLPVVSATALDPRSLFRDLAQAVLAFRQTSIAHQVAQYDLDERMKELSCLFDVSRIAQRDDLDIEQVLEAVVQRLPAAMRYPEIAAARIECGVRHFGSETVGIALSSDFVGIESQPSRLIVVYTGELPANAGDPFLAEEQALLEEIATHLAAAIERRRVSAVERDRQALLDAVIASAPDAIELIDAESLRFVEVNASSCRMLGYTRDEMLGMGLHQIQAAMTPEMLGVHTREIISSGGALFESRHRCKDGRLIDVSVSSRAIRQNNRDYLIGIWRDITAEKAAAAEIRKLSLVIEQSPTPIMITDLDGRIEYVNDAFTHNTGYTRDETLGKTPRLLKSGKTPVATYREMWQTLSDGKTWKGEFINRTRQGSEQIEEAIIVPLRQPDGKISHYVAIKEDITLRKEMSEELESYRAHLEQLVESRTEALNTAVREQNALFDAASAGIVLLRERKIVRCNHRMDEMFGYADGEQIGQSTRIWYQDDESFTMLGQEIYPKVERGEIDVRDFQFVRKDGRPQWCRLSSRAIDPSDLAAGLVVIFEDITAERVAAEALRLANDEQQAIFDTANSGIALIRERIIRRGNRRLHEMFGWPSGEMLGQSTAVWYVDEEANRIGGGEVYQQIWRGEVHRRDQELMRRDGSRFWARLTGAAVDLADHDKGTVWVIEDISVERAAIEQICHAQVLAEAAARMKSDFLANMSHEIRTPMNAIIGMSHLAMKTELTPRQRDYLKKIQGSSQHLLGIINDILDLSKIEAGKMIVEQIDFDLDQVFDNVAGLIAEKAAAKGLELIIDVDEDVPRSLIGDPLRLGQILINYANNAVKFTESGEIAIHVSVQEGNDQEVLLHFSVTDTGIGIDEEQRNRLFQSFEQADTSTTRKFGGTGLGLAISKQLAGLMHGEVGVDSEPGKGSTFWFVARLGRGQERARVLLPNPDLRGRRVLVVDDNEYARDVICDMLRAMTFHVSSAASGGDAVVEMARAAAVNETYEVIFLDWQMPVMDGIATAREIQKLSGIGSPHLVMITAFGRDEVMKAAGEAGFEDVLIKPVTASLLFDTVMRILGGVQPEAKQNFGAASPSLDLTEVAGARILLVEDNDLNQEVAMELLTDAGFVVELAENGAMALEMIGKQAPAAGYDIVLMDMQMPVMDGLTATREIRKLPQCADLPVVAMTANAMAGDRDSCLEAGMNDHVAKPIDPDVLWATLRRWIKYRNPSPALAAEKPEGPPRSVTAESFPTIPGVDVTAGLYRAMGRPDLYRSLLGRFVSGQKDFSERMQVALGASDWSLAERLAHTLKGVAAQIGAHDLRDRAEQFEAAIGRREALPVLNESLTEIARHLQSLVSSIEYRLPVKNEVPRAISIDTIRLGEVCAHLARQLEADDFLSAGTIEDNEALLRAAMGDQFDQFSSAVMNYDFGGARELLGQFAKREGVAL